jgi:hypothetical protein
VIPELRPRGIGEILDAAVSLYRARFASLIRYAALVVVPVQAFLTVVLLSAQPDSFSVTLNGSATPQFDTSRAQLGAILVVLLAGWITTSLVEAVTARIVADAYIGSAEQPSTAARAAARRILTVLAVGLVVGLCQIAGLFLCLVGALAVRGFFAVAVPAVILERKRVFSAMGRSIELTRTHFWHALGVVVTAMLIGALLNAALASALNIWSASGASPTTIVITQGLVNVIASCITTPLVAAVAVSLYFDLRIRDEAFDVQLAMAAA